MIPKIIHHIAPANTGLWHPFWSRCRQSWIDSFPNYRHILWNDEDDIDQLVKVHYPQYWNLYQSFPAHIMRIDFARLCILHRYGGIYADMDYFCYENFDEYLRTNNYDIYLVENATQEFTEASVENSLMASVQGSAFFTDTMKYVQACYIQLRNRLRIVSNKSLDWMNSESRFLINNTTGSGMLEMSRESYGRAYYNIGCFNTHEFNNRPGSYFDGIKTKHVHTTIWGKNQVSKDYKEQIVLIISGSMYTLNYIPKNVIDKIDLEKNYVLSFDSFDFYTDYTHGKYLFKHKNIDQTVQWIKDSEKHAAEIIKSFL